MSQDLLAQRFVFNNPDLANQYYAKDQSIILLLGHIGNWEWGQAIVSHYLQHNCVGVYKPLSNKGFDKYLLQQRSQYDVKLLRQKALLKYLISHPEETNVYIFIADQHAPNAPRKQLSFLNQSGYFDASVEKIATKYNLPIIYADIMKVSDHHYETDLVELKSSIPDTDQINITESYAHHLELNIMRQPELWLWSHKRWK